jgi:hypothetical protein
VRTNPKPDPNAPIFGRSAPQPTRKRAYHGPEENLREPAYKIANEAGELGSRTADVSHCRCVMAAKTNELTNDNHCVDGFCPRQRSTRIRYSLVVILPSH